MLDNKIRLTASGGFRNRGDEPGSGQLADMTLSFRLQRVNGAAHIVVILLEARGYQLDEPPPCETNIYLSLQQAHELSSWLQKAVTDGLSPG
jgi:hypothetical protein